MKMKTKQKVFLCIDFMLAGILLIVFPIIMGLASAKDEQYSKAKYEEVMINRDKKEVAILRKRTADLITTNCTTCTIERNNNVFDENTRITSFKKEIRENVKVKLSSLNTRQEERAMNIRQNINKQLYALTAMYDEDIKKDDLLKIANSDVIYKVVEIRNIYYGNHTKDNVYKKVGYVECWLSSV